jgi:pyridoxal phosphate enzyme (YggS family)
MISENIEVVRRRIAGACARVGRDVGGVTLVAVAKTFSAELVREVLSAGVGDIGENYVQELLAKRREIADDSVRWHFIGHLQSNKVRQIVSWIHMIHAVDSESLIREVDRRASAAGRMIDCLIEVNTTGDRSKFGIAPEEVIDLARRTENVTNVTLAGLMTIGPFLPDPEGSRPMFRLLRQLRDQVAGMRMPHTSMKELSMGMTGDFEVAIEEGATIIRIGTAIFGPRIRPDHQEKTL